MGVLMTKHTREALNHPWHRVNPQKMGLGDIAGGSWRDAPIASKADEHSLLFPWRSAAL